MPCIKSGLAKGPLMMMMLMIHDDAHDAEKNYKHHTITVMLLMLMLICHDDAHGAE